MNINSELRIERPFWPPMWNPFQVFLLLLSISSSIGLVQGNSGSKVLDERLSDTTVAAWGLSLLVGSIMALFGLFLYRRVESLMPGLYLERGGLVLVGTACTIYSTVIIESAPDLNDARWTVAIQTAYALACFYRAGQDHRAITRALNIAGRQPWRDLFSQIRVSFRRSSREASGGPRE